MNFAPPIDLFELTLRTYFDDFTRYGLTESDSERIQEGFTIYCRSSSVFPTPSDIFKAIPRRIHSQGALTHKLPELTDQQRRRNQKRVKKLLEKLTESTEMKT